MDRRQLLATSAGGLAAALVPKPIFPVTKSPPKAKAEFIGLRNEGHVASYFSDFTRAIQCFERAFRLGRSLASEYQADALDAMSSIRVYTRQNQNSLESNREKLNTDPASIVTRLELAGNLFSLGRYDEAETEYQKALSRGSDLISPENKQCWPLIGRYYFRRGNYKEAAEWFERTPETLHLREGTTVTRNGPKVTPEEQLLRHIESESTLNRVLAAAVLNDHARARALAALYISKVGDRLPHAHRWHLEQAGIDADAIYVEWYSQLS